MHSYTWMNQQHQQVGPPLQSPQTANHLTRGTMSNPQAGTAKNSCQYMGVRPQQNAFSFTFQDAANRGQIGKQMSNWQRSAVPDGKVSSQQLNTQKNDSYLLNVLHGNRQNSSINTQTKNPCLLGTNECQRTTQHNFHQNSVNQSSPSMIKANTTYIQQAQSAHWNPQVTDCPPPAITIQDGKVSHFQHYRVQKNLYAHGNKKSIKPISAYTQIAASFVREQAACASTLVSATAHNGQIACSSTNRQNSIQQGFSPSVPPPNMEGWTSFRNKNFAATSSSNGQTLDLSTTGQKTQQYPTHLNTVHSTGATSSVNSNPYSCQYQTTNFLAKTNERPLNPAAVSQTKRMVESVQTMYHAGSGGGLVCKSTSTTAMHVPMTESNKNMQPAMLTENYNSNSSQQFPLCTVQYLPKTTQSIISRAQHLTNAPQQSSIPNAFSVTATGDGRENGRKTDNPFSKGNLVESSSDMALLMQLHKCISQQAKETESSVPVKQNDSSIHSSPGCKGTRAVAVVQPLSQERYQVARKRTYSNTISQSDECTATEELPCYAEKLSVLPADKKDTHAAYLKEGSDLYPEKPNQMRSNQFVNRNSATSPDNGNVSSSDSPGLQKRLSSNERASATVPTTQQSVSSEVGASQNGDMDRSEMPVELSSFSTTPWTIKQLSRLILEVENRQKDFPVVDSTSMLLSTFWYGDCKTLLCKLKTGWYKDLMTNVNEFCSKHATSDSIILSQVKPQFQKKLKNCHVLKDNEVYSELPYKSSWLNINEKVDDIDKEFGYPWFLKHTGSQQYQDSTVKSNAAHIVSEVPGKVLSRGDREPLNSGEEKQAATVKTIPTQSSSSNKSENIDSNYSFELKVLSPEEAKAIFEQVQSMSMASQLDKEKNSPMDGELHEVVLLSDSKPEKESFSAVEQVCCLAGWIEILTGSNTPSLGKCQCKKKQSHNGSTDKILAKEETATQKNDKLHAITSDSKLHFAPKGGNHVDGSKNIDNQVITVSLPGLCDELNQTTDLTKDDETPHLFFDREPKNISQKSTNNSQSSSILLSQEDNSSNENKISNREPDFGIQMADPEECVQDHLKSSGSSQSSSKNDCKNKIKNVISVTNRMSGPEEDCAQVQLTSTDVAASSLEKQEQTKTRMTVALQTTVSLSAKHETVKRKRKTSRHLRIFSPQNKSKKCKSSVNIYQQMFKGNKYRTVYVDNLGGETSSKKVRTVELTLFGTTPKDKCNLIDKSRILSPESESEMAQRPPEVVSVNLSPLKRKSNVCTGANSHWIHDKRRSFPPTKIGQRRKLKTHTTIPTNTKELPARIWNGNTKRCQSLKRKRSIANGLKLKDETMKKHVVIPKLPADEDRNDSENGSCAVLSLHENNVLRFSVLPNTFNFEDGSNGTRKTIASVSDDNLVKGQKKSPNKSVPMARGTWSEKKYCPLSLPPAPTTASLFQEFQKKYIQKTQPSIDK
ncbi:protein AMN1 homolog [Mastacembelus armatus]|uniref:protein AMN1 homolog n=1 Tax=Mastacembelus armatus TaxID=205130 RepID=UPI000E4573F1|nr:uncharacterized protein LOC113133110 [Mastacembelus armatus]